MKNFISSAILTLLLHPASFAAAKDIRHDSPGAMNPVIPGYFADPTLKKFGDTYYIYATTDGSGAGFGPAQLWQSKDLVNWTLMPMNWPDSHWIWAPDVLHNKYDNKYYYIYCQPCKIHVGVGDTPRGPWKNILGESEAVLVPDRFVENAITLDGQTFVDDDGSVYMYWGTWGIYKGFGCGAGKLTPDMKGFTETRLIPNTEVTDFFEAPYVLKKDGVYYFMYSSGSCHDHTYRVQYATSDKPLGPYTYQGCILETNKDGSIHGPGHHSVLKEGNDYYIIYHRHDNPHSNRGFHRQVCIDRMVFKNGKILPVKSSHKGVGALGRLETKGKNLAFGKNVTASSNYDDNFKPEYAVDDNNGTLWRPAGMGQEWLEIDLGKKERIRTIRTQWEYGTQFYQYFIETSLDGKNWEIFADKRNNRLAGSPMSDFGDKDARYVRITSTGGEKVGFNGAIWNVKIYNTVERSAPQQWLGLTGADWDGCEWNNNHGQLGGSFTIAKGKVDTRRIDGKDAISLQPNTVLVFENALLSPDMPMTASAIAHNGKTWENIDLKKNVENGRLIIKSNDVPFTITNLRLYNWELTDAEKRFDSETPLRRMSVANRERIGTIVDLNAEIFNVGDTVTYIPNVGIEGYFEALSSPAVIENIKGKKALRFDGNTFYRSSFPLPSTIRDNAPYTLEAVILNPEIAENECYADFTSTHDELEKIMGVNGTEPRCGVMNHYGWYEDAGWKDVKKLEGEWQHILVKFDGRMERVFINGNLVSEKDIQLLVKPSQFVTLGRNAEDEWHFSGYIHSIRLSDDCN